MKKKVFKRACSLLLTATIFVSLFNGNEFFLKSIDASVNVEYKPGVVGVNLLPNELASYDKFMREYVTKQDGFNVTSEFKATSYSNINGGLENGNSLSTDRKYWHGGNNHWEANFEFDFSKNSKLLSLINNNEIKTGYKASLTSDEHRHIGSPGTHGKQWDVASLTYCGETIYSEKKYDGSGQDFSDDIDVKSGTKSLKWNMAHKGCNCGSSGVAGSVVYLVDKTAPKITSVYASTDKYGENRLAENAGFKKNMTGYIVLEFSEDIRFANNTSEELTLNLDLFNTKNDQQVTGDTITASLKTLKDNKMIFEFHVSSRLNGESTNVYIKSISGKQDWVGNLSKSFKYSLVSYNGDTKEVSDEMKEFMTCSSKITDLAGNPINWSDSKKQLDSKKIYLDSISPELKKVNISGDMITPNSETNKDSWSDSFDRSSTYLSVGEEVKFSCSFTEDLIISDMSKVKAVLNVKDQSGNPIELSLLKKRTEAGKDTYGKDAPSLSVTILDFENLKVSERMLSTTETIKIVKFIGLNDARDSVGNYLESPDKVTITPAQKLYLDTSAPSLTTTLSKDQTENDKYVPNPTDGFVFTVPISVKDDGENSSGITGLYGNFSMRTEGVHHNYEWYMDNNPSVKKSDVTWDAGWSDDDFDKASKEEFPENNSNLYLHFKLSENDIYTTSEFNATLKFELKDHAGNTKSQQLKIKYDVDNVAPTTEVVSQKASLLTGNKIQLRTKIRVSDRFGIGNKLIYEWTNDEDIKTKNEIELKQGVSDEVEVVIEYDSKKNKNYKYIGFEVADKKENLKKSAFVFSYNFNTVNSKYTIPDKGSEVNPLIKEKLSVTIDKPDDVVVGTDGNVGNKETARTMMLIPLGKENISGEDKDTYLVFLQKEHVYDGNIFENLPDTEGNTTYKFKDGHWFKAAGEITVTDNEQGSFEILEEYNEANIYKVGQYVYNLYGKKELVFVTSTELTDSNLAQSVLAFSADALRNKVEREEAYFAMKTEYNLEFEDVINSKKESVVENVCIDKNNKVVDMNSKVKSLREVFVKVGITNLTDTEKKEYGYTLIDTEKSNYTLTEVVSAGNGEETYTYTGRLEPVESQLLCFPEEIKYTGVYKLQVNIVTYDGATYTFEPDYYLYVDKSNFSVNATSYNKVYVDLDRDLIIPAKDNEQIVKNTEVVKIGFADMPSEYLIADIKQDSRADNSLTFTKTENNELDESSGYMVNNTWEIRAWSVLDVNGEENAQWHDMGESLEYKYELVKVDEFTKDSYKEIVLESEDIVYETLPLMVGDNKVNYEIRKSNGEIVRNSIILRVGTGTSEVFISEYYHYKNHACINVEYDDDLKENGGKVFVQTNDEKSYYFNKTEGESTSLFVDTPTEYHFWISNSYGNITLDNYYITDLDSKKPYAEIIQNDDADESGVKNGGFHFKAHAEDEHLDINGLGIAFDWSYSMLLHGNNGMTNAVIAKVPINTEGDRVWEGYSEENYGIYRTKLLNYENKDGYISYDVEIWGEFKYNPDLQEGEEASVRLAIHAMDEAENVGYSEKTYYYLNEKPKLQIDKFNNEGYPVMTSYSQIKNITGFGTTNLVRNVETYDDYINCSMTIPAMCLDGEYTYKYEDMFGTEYTQAVSVNIFDTSDIKVTFSHTEATNSNVVVAVETVNEDDYITEINGSIVDENGQTKTISGNIDKMDASKSSIEMSDNGRIVVKTKAGKIHPLIVTNIDRVLEDAKIVFSYNGVSEPVMSDEKDTIYTKATAIVQCDESIEGINGTTSYTFPYGSKKGDTYTFEYADDAGNVGKITATLPYNIKENVATKPEIDNKAPEFEMKFSGMRDEKYIYLSNFYASDTGSDISTAAGEYIAQKYEMRMDISDDSGVKLILKKPGSAKVTSYEDSSDTIDGVGVTNTIVTVRENTAFDMYLVDESDNVTEIKGFNFTSVDNEVPEIIPVYEPIKTKEGYEGIRVWFQTINDEKIISLDSDICAILTEKTNGENVLTYYKDYEENVIEKFNYKDIYGNLGTVNVEVQTLDTETPVVTSMRWYGIGGKSTPDELDLDVSNDIVAQLKCSKVVCKVDIYEYDESASDKKGQLITENLPVKTEFKGMNVLVTYEQNVSKPLVIEMVATGNGRKAVYTLPAVEHIDKTGPKVEIESSSLSENHLKNTYTLTTDEPAMLKDNPKAGYTTKHTWTTDKNGKQVVLFNDMSGNVTEYTVNVTEIDDVLLELKFSRSSSGANAKDSLLEMNVQQGETIYVMSNKAAQISIEGQTKDVKAGEWSAFHFNMNIGIYIFKAVDSITQRVVYDTVLVKMVDTIEPVIGFESSTVRVDEGASIDDVNMALHQGVSVVDSNDGEISDYEITGVPDKIKHGYFVVTYTAYDKSGNKATAQRTLYVAYKDEPTITINDIKAMPYEILFTDKNVHINVDGVSDKGLVIKYRCGTYTTGQMKYCTNVIKNNSTISLTSKRYYTIYVRTATWDEYIYYVYVG